MKIFNFIFVNLIFSFNILLNNVNSIKMPNYVLYNKNNIVGDCSWVLDKSFINHYRYFSKHNIICHKDIMIFYNLNYKLPFSSYAIHSSQQVNNLLGGRKTFINDPLIPNNKQHSPDDYIFKSPYSRGHLTPSHIMSYNKTDNGPWYQTYYITNVLPQSLRLNEGQWELFEQNIINKLSSLNNTIWEIYTGGSWNPQISKNKFATEEYIFWKAICNRELCDSVLISAYTKPNNTIFWEISNINKYLTGYFSDCCSDKFIENDWKNLLPI